MLVKGKILMKKGKKGEESLMMGVRRDKMRGRDIRRERVVWVPYDWGVGLFVLKR